MSVGVVVLLVVALLAVVVVLVVGIVGPSWARRHEDRADADRAAALTPSEPVRVSVPTGKVLVAGYARDRLQPRRSPDRSPWAEFRHRSGTPRTPAPITRGGVAVSGSPGRHRLRSERGDDVVAAGLIPSPTRSPDGGDISTPEPGAEPVRSPGSAGPGPVSGESSGGFGADSRVSSDTGGSSVSF